MEKYLRHYAEPEIKALDGMFKQGQWENVLVIPACNETSDFLRPPPPCDGRSLMILVINESVSAAPEASKHNQALAAAVREKFTPIWQSVPEFGLSLFEDPLAAREILLVDRFSNGHKLPVKGGVGHARKTGADLATNLIFQGRVRSNWIHCSDADVELPQAYFTVSNTLKDPASKYAALIYPFHHQDDPLKSESKEVVLATQLYELSLRYYVAGMKYAHSPYAFHTIGSTMAVSAAHYAKVRGFPRREAGEDFYLLNKLAKVGSVLEPGSGADCEPIVIEARRSDRVPFGTGAAVNKITGLADLVSDFRFYDPALFELLRLWLQSLPVIWQSGTNTLDANTFPEHPGGHNLHVMLQSLLTSLKEMKTEKALEHAFKQSKSLDQFTRQMHTWFDAFRTLKLIHALRDQRLSNIGFAALERNLTFSRLLENDPDLLSFYNSLQIKGKPS